MEIWPERLTKLLAGVAVVAVFQWILSIESIQKQHALWAALLWFFHLFTFANFIGVGISALIRYVKLSNKRLMAMESGSHEWRLSGSNKRYRAATIEETLGGCIETVGCLWIALSFGLGLLLLWMVQSDRRWDGPLLPNGIWPLASWKLNLCFAAALSLYLLCLAHCLARSRAYWFWIPMWLMSFVVLGKFFK